MSEIPNGLAEALANISRTVTASYAPGMDPELVMRRRVGKVSVEAGELADAIEGFTGENPRKGVYATRDDVIKELIDCASASLCAVEYMTGDQGLSVSMLAEHVAGNWERLSAALAAVSGRQS
jgi:NTP pyrophosphatase (non-canonical NTP hydrolase)